MRIRQRALAALILLLLFCGVSLSPRFAVPAAAEKNAPDLGVSVAIEPDSLVVPGEVTLTFTMVNHTSKLLESLCLTSADGTLVEPIGDLAPAETKDFVRVHTVTQAELDDGSIPYIITCVSGRDHFSYPAGAAIIKSAAEPEVQFLRRVSNLTVSDGGTSTIVYRVNNVGNVAITDVSVVDPLGNLSRQIDTLDVGESRVFIQHVSISGDAVSSPSLTYTTVSEEQGTYTTKLDDLPLNAATGVLDASITAGRSMFAADIAEVILHLSNASNVDYDNITIYDDIYGGVIADSVRLPAGGMDVDIAHSYPLRGDSSYRWRVTGQSSAGGRIDFVTDTVEVAEEAEGDEVLLVFKASTTMPKISRRGYVPVRLEVNNLGSDTVTDVVITDASGAEIYTFAAVPTGEPTVRELRVYIEDDVSLAYFATYAGTDGELRTDAAEPVEITIGRGGQMPESDEPVNPLFGGLSTQMHNTPLFMAMLIGSCTVLLALIIAMLIFSRRAHIQRRERDAARKQRIKEEMAKTAPFKPIRRGETK